MSWNPRNLAVQVLMTALMPEARGPRSEARGIEPYVKVRFAIDTNGMADHSPLSYTEPYVSVRV